MGRPKALVRSSDGSSWLLTARDRLLAAGCSRVLVVLGAEADRARRLLDGAESVRAERWQDGIGASLRAGLIELGRTRDDAVLVHLVDLPDVGVDVMRRVLERTAPSALRRAVYDGVPGHPVLIGRDHWSDLAAVLDGDVGARHYLERHDVESVECSDLATGRDVDTLDGFGSADAPETS